MTPEATELIREHYAPDTILAQEPYDLDAGEPSRAHNRRLAPTLMPKLHDTAPRIADTDAMGVDVQVLASFVSQNYYWTGADLGRRFARLQNERLAEAVAEHPDRFRRAGAVVLIHPSGSTEGRRLDDGFLTT